MVDGSRPSYDRRGRFCRLFYGKPVVARNGERHADGIPHGKTEWSLQIGECSSFSGKLCVSAFLRQDVWPLTQKTVVSDDKLETVTSLLVN